MSQMSRFGDERLPQRFWRRVVADGVTGCWIWVGHIDDWGYGVAYRHPRNVKTHRWTYETFIGPIPPGLQLDHVKARGCTTKACCNPDHLEAVTPSENTRRGDTLGARCAAKTHCPSGHPYDEVNTRLYQGRRYCRECHRIRSRSVGSGMKDNVPRSASGSDGAEES